MVVRLEKKNKRTAPEQQIRSSMRSILLSICVSEINWHFFLRRWWNSIHTTHATRTSGWRRESAQMECEKGKFVRRYLPVCQRRWALRCEVLLYSLPQPGMWQLWMLRLRRLAPATKPRRSASRQLGQSHWARLAFGCLPFLAAVFPMFVFGELFEFVVAVVGEDVDAWAEGGDGVWERNEADDWMGPEDGGGTTDG